MCVYKQEPWTDRDARPRICHCARVILDILPWKRRDAARRSGGGRGEGDRRSIAGHTNHCCNTPGIDDTSAVLLFPLQTARTRRACLDSRRHEASLPLSLYETCTRDDSSSTTGSAEHWRKKKIVVGIAARITRSRGRQSSYKRMLILWNVPYAKRNVPGIWKLFFDLYARLKIVSSWACTYLTA